MARPRALTKKWSRDRVREHRQREKDRAELMAVFSAACPKGIGEHIGIRIELEGGEPRLVWNLDDVGAAFLNEFAASIITDPNTGGADAIMRELSLHIGKKLIQREYDWQ